MDKEEAIMYFGHGFILEYLVEKIKNNKEQDIAEKESINLNNNTIIKKLRLKK